MGHTCLEIVRVDGDDLDDLLAEIEQSFAVSLPQDLRHVQTAGDLFAEILRCRAPDGAGAGCDTQMAFYRLRRLLVSAGLDSAATPHTALRGQGLLSPRRLAALIERELGLHAPPRVVSTVGCALIIGLAAAGIGATLWQGSADWLALLPLALPVLLLDRGGWSGDWTTLGSLAEAVAAHNVARLARQGARDDERQWWIHHTKLLCGIVWDGREQLTDHRLITRDTRFAFA